MNPEVLSGSCSSSLNPDSEPQEPVLGDLPSVDPRLNKASAFGLTVWMKLNQNLPTDADRVPAEPTRGSGSDPVSGFPEMNILVLIILHHIKSHTVQCNISTELLRLYYSVTTVIFCITV